MTTTHKFPSQAEHDAHRDRLHGVAAAEAGQTQALAQVALDPHVGDDDDQQAKGAEAHVEVGHIVFGGGALTTPVVHLQNSRAPSNRKLMVKREIKTNFFFQRMK